MKTLQTIGIFTVLLFGLASSCKDSEDKNNDEGDDSPRIVRNTKVLSPKSNTKYKLGDTISFSLESRGIKIDSVVLELENEKQTFRSPNFSYQPSRAKTGTQKFKLSAYFGGKSETHYPRLTFLSDVEPDLYGYQILRTYPHDPKAFTQGLSFKNDTLIESTGQRGTSWISKINLETGEKYLQKNLSNEYFGEGSCFWNDQYIQLTWTSQIGFVYDNNFNQTKTFNYTHEGWGITVWGDTLYVSDGTHVIHLLDPRDFSEIGKLEVYDHEGKIVDLNELEMVEGELYANMYQKNAIAVIDPLSGKLLKLIDLTGLLTREQRSKTDVLNGIAYHPGWKKLFVTGKLWPSLFDVEIIKKSQ